jgi:hypothetical protein
VQKPPYHAVHISHGKKEHAVLLQQPKRGGKRHFREGDMFEHVGHADDAPECLVIEVFDRSAMSLVA